MSRPPCHPFSPGFVQSLFSSLWQPISLVLSLCALVNAQAPASPETGSQTEPGDAAAVLARADWSEDEIGVGVLLRHASFAQLFEAPQYLCVLFVERPGKSRRLRFAALTPVRRIPTSQLARSRNALAAVNCGFFDMKTGTPVGLLMEGGVVKSEQDERRTVAIGVDRREQVHIEELGPGRWPAMQHARGSWPMLLRDGAPVRPEGYGPRDIRHPRTAAGLTRDGSLVLVTVDGRNEKAAGMTLLELAHTMRALGCVTAMNFDGGGSTTMWCRGRGVVNHPSDNERFDHLGERAIADIAYIQADRVLRFDEDRARLSPAEAWRQEAGERCIEGDYAVADGGATVEFSVQMELLGKYALEVRWPQVDDSVEVVELTFRDEAPRQVPVREFDQWVEMATVDVPFGESRITLRGVGDGAFAIDAVRLVEKH